MFNRYDSDKKDEANAGDKQHHDAAKKALKYAFLPEILPRLKIFANLFAQILHVFTFAFGVAGLIPKNHPMLRDDNIGKYKFGDAVRLAMSNVQWNKQGLPSILAFVGIIGTMILAAATLFLLLFYTIFSSAEAMAQNSVMDMSLGNAPQSDKAANFIHSVIGTHIGDESDTFNSPLIVAVKSMLTIYSNILLGIAVIMVLYILVKNVVQSARTGQPFSDQFNPVWAPIRLVLAFAMLVPINGYNLAQIGVIHVGYWGSNLANILWSHGARAMQGEIDNKLNAPIPYNPNEFLYVTLMGQVCQELWNLRAEEIGGGTQGQNQQNTGIAAGSDMAGLTEQYNQGRNSENAEVSDINHDIVLGLSNDVAKNRGQSAVNAGGTEATVISRHYFGVLDTATYCGAVQFPKVYDSNINHSAIINLSNAMYNWATGVLAVTESNPSKTLQDQGTGGFAWSIARDIYAHRQSGGGGIGSSAEGTLHQYFTKQIPGFFDALESVVSLSPTEDAAANDALKRLRETGGQGTMDSDMREVSRSIAMERADIVIEESNKYGWASAGVVFTRLTDLNAVLGRIDKLVPKAVMAPELLNSDFRLPSNSALADRCKDIRSASCQNLISIFQEIRSELLALSKAMAEVAEDTGQSTQGRWTEMTARIEGTNDENTFYLRGGGKAAVEDIIQGAMTLMDSSLIDIDQDDPFNTLVGIGQTAFVIARKIDEKVGEQAAAKSQDGGAVSTPFGMMSSGSTGLLYIIWFTLTVVLPFMPFVYFMFAIVEWVMSIFEAILGMPLWALAFLSTDGDSLISQKALSGAMMIFEVFLRPAVIIFSFVATVMLFKATTTFFNWAYLDFILFNNPNDDWMTKLAFLLLYAFGCYAIAQSCFKLIDKLPRQFMRWIGENVQGFGGVMDHQAIKPNPFLMQQGIGALPAAQEQLSNNAAWNNMSKEKQQLLTSKTGGNPAAALVDGKVDFQKVAQLEQQNQNKVKQFGESAKDLETKWRKLGNNSNMPK